MLIISQKICARVVALLSSFKLANAQSTEAISENGCKKPIHVSADIHALGNPPFGERLISCNGSPMVEPSCVTSGETGLCRRRALLVQWTTKNSLTLTACLPTGSRPHGGLSISSRSIKSYTSCKGAYATR